MKINDDAPVPTTATQPAKLLWTTPRVVPLLADVGTQGKSTLFPRETTFPPTATISGVS